MVHYAVIAKRNLVAATSRQKAYADTKRLHVTCVMGDWVWLSTANLRLQGTRKFLPRFVGPYTVSAAVGKQAYRLDLPAHMRIHPVMHVSLLKRHKAGDRTQPPLKTMMVNDDEEFEVDCILLHRTSGKKTLEFLVRWKGYDASFDTWEPQDNLAHAGETLSGYWRNQGAKPVRPT